MTEHVCNNCGYTSEKKTNYERHINRKSGCLPPEIFCSYCGKGFESERGVSRHIANSCPGIKGKKVPEEKEEQCDSDDVVGNDDIKCDIARVTNNVSGDIINSNNTCGNLNIHGNSNSVNSNNTTNNTVNDNRQIINEIVIVPFGKEDISILSPEEMRRAYLRGYMSPVRIIKFMHFNPNRPEYHNVYTNDHKDGYAFIHDGTKWNTMRTREVVDALRKKAKEIYEKYIDDKYQGDRKKEGWLDVFDEKDMRIVEVSDGIKLLLINGRDNAKNVRKLNETLEKLKRRNIDKRTRKKLEDDAERYSSVINNNKLNYVDVDSDFDKDAKIVRRRRLNNRSEQTDIENNTPEKSSKSSNTIANNDATREKNTVEKKESLVRKKTKDKKKKTKGKTKKSVAKKTEKEGSTAKKTEKKKPSVKKTKKKESTAKKTKKKPVRKNTATKNNDVINSSIDKSNDSDEKDNKSTNSDNENDSNHKRQLSSSSNKKQPVPNKINGPRNFDNEIWELKRLAEIRSKQKWPDEISESE